MTRTTTTTRRKGDIQEQLVDVVARVVKATIKPTERPLAANDRDQHKPASSLSSSKRHFFKSHTFELSHCRNNNSMLACSFGQEIIPNNQQRQPETEQDQDQHQNRAQQENATSDKNEHATRVAPPKREDVRKLKNQSPEKPTSKSVVIDQSGQQHRTTQMSVVLGLTSSRCSLSKPPSNKMHPPNGRQLIISGSVMLILLSLLTTLNWGTLFGTMTPQQKEDACSGRAWRCGSGPSQLTISASAANSNTFRQHQFSETPLEYEAGSTTTRVPTTTTLATTTTTSIPTSPSSSIVSESSTSEPSQLTSTPSVQGDLLLQQPTTEQTTATLSAPMTTTPTSTTRETVDSQRERVSNNVKQQHFEESVKLVKPKMSDGQHNKLVKVGKIKVGHLVGVSGPTATEARTNVKVQSIGWRAIEPLASQTNWNHLKGTNTTNSSNQLEFVPATNQKNTNERTGQHEQQQAEEVGVVVGRHRPTFENINNKQFEHQSTSSIGGHNSQQVPSTNQQQETSSTLNARNYQPQTYSRPPSSSFWADKQVATNLSDWSIDSSSGQNQVGMNQFEVNNQRQQDLFTNQTPASQSRQQVVHGSNEASGHQTTTTTTTSEKGRQMLESALRDALDDLLTSAAGSPEAAKIKRPAPMSRIETPLTMSQLSMLDLAQFQRPSQPTPTASSQSAPLISLPPISHFLTPRNPFKLFASASSPVATRYWPMFGSNSNSNSNPGQSNQQPRHATRWFMNGGDANHGSQNGVTNQNRPRLNHQQSLPINNHHDSAALELESISSQLHNQVMAPMSLSGSLFAHSQSAEQLEKLVREASQAGHLPRGSPPILPAIVSGPGGQTFPGFYIPAIDQDSTPSSSGQHHSESTASSFNHAQQMRGPWSAGYLAQDSMVSASSSGDSSPTGGLYSTIPGTDYVLHPDEVRAMIDIGESAWRKQQQQQQQQQTATAGSSNHQQQVASSASQPQSAASFGHLWQRPNEAQNLMQENHLENLRNYAYIENIANNSPNGPSYSNEHLQGASSATNERQLGTNGTVGQQEQSQQVLGAQLNRALLRARSKALPAIIRVNDQDYVHWPLIQAQEQEAGRAQRGRGANNGGHEHLNTGASSGRHTSSSMAPPVGQNSLLFSGTQNSPVRHQQYQHLQTFDHSPVRLSTQLTPNEIRQVEDSILETLIVAQTLQHQRSVMEAFAASTANQQRQLAPNNKPKWLLKSVANNNRGFFGRRKRRKRNSTNNKLHPSVAMRPTSVSASRQQFMSILPLLNAAASPISLYSTQPILLSGGQHVQNQQQLASSVAAAADINNQQMRQLTNSDLQQAGESKMNQRLPTVMADQETNKPDLVSSIDSISTAASSSTGAAMRSFLGSGSGIGDRLSLGNKNKTNSNSEDQAHSSDAAFGSRMRPSSASSERNAKSLTTTIGTAASHKSNESGDGGLMKEEDSREKSDNFKSKHQVSSSKLHNHFVTFVPVQNNRSKQISLYTNGAGGAKKDTAADSAADTSTLAAQESRGSSGGLAAQHGRFNPVDWPAMVSDADYFPAGQPNGRQSLHQERLAKLNTKEDDLGHRQQDLMKKSFSSDGAASLASDQSKPPRTIANQNDAKDDFNDDDDEHEHEPVDGEREAQEERIKQPKRAATFQVIQAPSTRRGNYVTTQMKLQFSQDYQAREGVPIYNNNVRVAGALDRERNINALVNG